MKRHLIPQMLHEWRSNLWLLIELMLVSGVVCYLCADLYGLAKSIFDPLGFDPENVYTMSLRVINQESPEFDPGEDAETTVWHDTRNMLARLRANPHVEAVAISDNAYPFSMMYMGNSMRIEGMPDSIRYNGNLRKASPDIVRVLRLEAISGITAEEMETRLRNGEFLLADFPVGDNAPFTAISQLVGKKFTIGIDSLTEYKAAGVIPIITRTSYESRQQGMMLFPIDESSIKVNWGAMDLILRVKEGEGKAFERQFASDPSIRRLGNIVLHDLQSLHQRKEAVERSNDITARMTIAMILFFLIIVFLGLLGTFWYRVQQRTPEIALRKVSGATDGDIFRRLLSESCILLVTAFLAGATLYALYYHHQIQESTYAILPWKDAFVGIGAAYVVMQVIVLLGVWIPARRAMKVEPAIALKDE